MHYVSLIVEFLRGKPAVVFWTAALGQAALWFVTPSLFYSAPPTGLADVLMVGHEFQLGSYLGPPLSFWLAELAFKSFGIFGVYLLAQVCVVVAYWAVFKLGCATVGVRHAALAILLMVGISALTLQTADFGPAVLAMPLWGLALLHFWRAVGERNRGFWLVLAVELGLLLLTSYTGIILLVSLAVFALIDARSRAAFRHVEPWIAAAFVLFIVAPYVAWLANKSEFGLVSVGLSGQGFKAEAGIELWSRVLLAHFGLFVLVLLASGLPRRGRQLPPLIDAELPGASGRLFVFFFALTPPLLAIALAAATGGTGPIEQLAPLVLLSGLAVIMLAGGQVKLYRERLVSFAWLGLLVAPPVLIVLGLGLAPWVVGAEFKVSQPAGSMGRYFADSFERRTGRRLEYVAGDQRIASIVALAAPSRPVVFLNAAPDRSPWTSAERFREKGGIIVWPTNDTAGTPPAAIREKFPGLVAEVPRVFERPVQGRLPLMRIGWAVVRPAGAQVSQ
jgi:hypothetical protein